MLRTPAICASCSPKIETPPVPSSNTLWPGRKRATSNIAHHAVTAAHGSVAASSSVM